MIVKGSFRVGGASYAVEIDEKDVKSALNQVITLTNPPFYCDVCKNNDPDRFKLVTNKDKEGNIYVSIQCINAGCFAKCNLGTYKQGGYFWRKPFEKYEKKASADTETNAEKAPFETDFP